MKISAVIITYNEESNIEDCLKSVEWCDEVVVVDSNSTDATPRICKEHGVVFLQRAWKGINDQRQFAVTQAANDWILAVDADERVTPQLREEIEAIRTGDGGCAGYMIPRHTWYLGRWIDHGGWFPDYKLRLFDRRRGARYEGTDPHDRVSVDGQTKRLKGELHHYTYRDLAHQLRTIDSFSATRARLMHETGTKFHPWKLAAKPVGKFIETYLWKRGFLDGLPGFIISVSTAYYVFLVWAKLWEMRRK